jgi:hypothetical protein
VRTSVTTPIAPALKNYDATEAPAEIVAAPRELLKIPRGGFRSAAAVTQPLQKRNVQTSFIMAVRGDGGHSPTGKSFRSGAAVARRPWLLAKGSGFSLASGRLPGFVSALQTARLGQREGGGARQERGSGRTPPPLTTSMTTRPPGRDLDATRALTGTRLSFHL